MNAYTKKKYLKSTVSFAIYRTRKKDKLNPKLSEERKTVKIRA